MHRTEESSKSKQTFQPLPKTTLPPVIHTKYIPHKPRKQPSQQQSPLIEQSHVTRQHSYNAQEYEMHRRARVERRANSQILSESPISPQFLHSLRAGSLSSQVQTPRSGGGNGLPAQSSLTSHRLPSAGGLDIASRHLNNNGGGGGSSTPTPRPRQGFGQMMKNLAESESSSNVEPTTPMGAGNGGNPRAVSASTAVHPHPHSHQPTQMKILDTPSDTSSMAGQGHGKHGDNDDESDDSFVLIDTDELDPTYHREKDRENTRQQEAAKASPKADNLLTAAGVTPLFPGKTFPFDANGNATNASQFLESVLDSPTEKAFEYANKKPPIGSLHPQLLCCNSVYTSKGINLNYVEDGHDACLMHIEIIRYMKQGAIAIKHGRYGRPHSTKIRLADNARSFNWSGKKITNSDKVVRFTWITKIIHGQTSKVFERYPDERVSPLSFTVYYRRPNKYNHEIDSDDDEPFTTDSVSFSPQREPIPGQRRSTWKTGYEETSLDIVLEDPNDFLIWFQGLRLLTNMALNKLAIHDPSLRLNKKTESVLLLPILTGYPSSHFIHDHITGLDVQEQFENEQFHENIQVNAQVALTRKDTVKSIRRYGHSQQSSIPIPYSESHPQRSNTMDNDRSFSGHLPIGTTPPSLNANQFSSAVAGSSGSYSSSSLARSINNSRNDLPVGSVAIGAGGDAALSVSTQASELELAMSYPTPWSSISVQGRSGIVDTSWIQQIVHLGPKTGHIYTWTRAYSLDTSASRMERMIEKIQVTQREILLDERKTPGSSGHGSGGSSPSSSTALSSSAFGSAPKYSSASVNPRGVTTTPRAHSVSSAYGYGIGASAGANAVSSFQHHGSGSIGGYDDDDVGIYRNTSVAQRNKIYQSFLSRAGGLHIIILRASDGTIFGGYGTSMWTPHTGFSGSPDCFVFRILDEDVNMSYSDEDISETESYNEDKVHQLHVYRWCGDPDARYFQFTSTDAFGFGSGTSKPGAMADTPAAASSSAAAVAAASLSAPPVAAISAPTSGGSTQPIIMPSNNNHHTSNTPALSFNELASAHPSSSLSFHRQNGQNSQTASDNTPPALTDPTTGQHRQTVTFPPPILDKTYSSATSDGSTTNVSVTPVVLTSHPSAATSPLHQRPMGGDHDHGTLDDPHAKENGPAFSLDKDLRVGFSYPCPVFHSPRLSSTRIFDCLMLEVWVPIPQ